MVVTLEQLLPDSNQLNLSSAELGVSWILHNAASNSLLWVRVERGLSEDMYICGMWEGKGTGGRMRSSFWKGVVKYTLKQKQKPLPIYFFIQMVTWSRE